MAMLTASHRFRSRASSVTASLAPDVVVDERDRQDRAGRSGCSSSRRRHSWQAAAASCRSTGCGTGCGPPARAGRTPGTRRTRRSLRGGGSRERSQERGRRDAASLHVQVDEVVEVVGRVQRLELIETHPRRLRHARFASASAASNCSMSGRLSRPAAYGGDTGRTTTTTSPWRRACCSRRRSARCFGPEKLGLPWRLRIEPAGATAGLPASRSASPRTCSRGQPSASPRPAPAARDAQQGSWPCPAVRRCTRSERPAVGNTVRAHVSAYQVDRRLAKARLGPALPQIRERPAERDDVGAEVAQPGLVKVVERHAHEGGAWLEATAAGVVPTPLVTSLARASSRSTGQVASATSLQFTAS